MFVLWLVRKCRFLIVLARFAASNLPTIRAWDVSGRVLSGASKGLWITGFSLLNSRRAATVVGARKPACRSGPRAFTTLPLTLKIDTYFTYLGGVPAEFADNVKAAVGGSWVGVQCSARTRRTLRFDFSFALLPDLGECNAAPLSTDLASPCSVGNFVNARLGRRDWAPRSPAEAL